MHQGGEVFQGEQVGYFSKSCLALNAGVGANTGEFELILFPNPNGDYIYTPQVLYAELGFARILWRSAVLNGVSLSESEMPFGVGGWYYPNVEVGLRYIPDLPGSP